jgi:uncharacterized RDD family membrane protein YckC
MEDNWHYAIAGQGARGPVSKYDLGRILHARALHAGNGGSDFLVWRPGMSDWARPENVAALRDSFPSPPPIQEAAWAANPTPAETAASSNKNTDGGPYPSSVTHPWRRYFARIWDIYVFVFVLAFFVGILFPSVFAAQQSKADQKLQEWLFQIMGLFAFVPFEAFCLHIFGNTMGKALYGIRISTRSGDNLSLSAALKRSFLVLMRGLGFGIPLVSLVTLANAHTALQRDGISSWDRGLCCIIHHRPISYFRIFVLIVTW